MTNQMIDTSQLERPATQRILVVANATLEGDALRDLIRLSTDGGAPAQLLVITPALNSRLRHWLSDDDEARRSARLRLLTTLEGLRAGGAEADGRVGDADPLQAITDALHEFRAHTIVIATHREGRTHWLARDLLERVRRRFAQPVLQVGVEPGKGSALDSEPATRAGAREFAARRPSKTAIVDG